MLILIDRIFEQIREERQRQTVLHGEHNAGIHPLSSKWFVITMEELGEAAQVQLYLDNQEEPSKDLLDAYESELIQATSVLVAQLERIKEYRNEKA